MSPRRVSFDVRGIAEPKGSTRMVPVKGRERPVITSDNPRLKDWQHQIALHASIAVRGDLFVGAVTLLADFTLPRPKSLPRKVTQHVKKPDLDKLVRATKDALTGVVYLDDSQVDHIHACKRYAIAAEAPHVLITIAESAPSPIETAYDLLASLAETTPCPTNNR